MILKPLKRAPLSSSPETEVVEFSAGLAAEFVHRMEDFPKEADGNPSGKYFAALRAILHLHDGGKPFIVVLMNSLHEQNPTLWPDRLPDDEPVRRALDAISPEYLVRLVDYFMDHIGVQELEEINVLIRDKVWPDRTQVKND